MKLFDKVLKRIDIGKEGNNKGLSHGMERLRQYLPDINKGTYYLVGAETSAGKTSFVDNFFMYNPYEHLMSNPNTDIKLNIIYFSLEIDKEIKITKGIARKLYIDYNLEVDVNAILSRGKYRISDEVYSKVLETRHYFEKLEDNLVIFDVPAHPTAIYDYLKKYADANGKFIEEGHQVNYIPNNPKLHTIIIVDHIGLVKKQQGLNKKDNIDKLSEYMIYFRNKCGFIPVLISQFNRTISSTDRFKLEMVTPQLSDFKDSGGPSEDANVVMALFNPHRYAIENFIGYDINKLKGTFRSLSLLKNRDGEDSKTLGMKFVGSCGYFSELPKPEEMIQNGGFQLNIKQ